MCQCECIVYNYLSSAQPTDAVFLLEVRTLKSLFYRGYYYDNIIIDNFCIALFSGVPKLTALYNILQHFLSFTNIIHIIMTTNNV